MRSITFIITTLCVVFSCLFLTSAQGWEDSAVDVSSQDLMDLGALCEPEATCSNVSVELNESSNKQSNNNNYYFNRHCDCDALCVKYETCCVDSPHRKPMHRLRGGRRPEQCITPPGNSLSFFMVSECHPRISWNPKISDQCYNYSMRNPYSLLPAFDSRDNVTYKNIYCAICNGVELAELKVWTMTLYKNLRQSYSEKDLIEYLTYDEKSDSWGHWENSNGNWEFFSVEITTNIPIDHRPRFCIKGLLQHCDPTWTDRSIFRKCHSYVAPVYAARGNDTSRLKRYRNVHCAICNFAELKPGNVCKLEFFPAMMPPGAGAAFAPGLSFTLLIDVNPKDGNLVGQINKCKSGESYDPFFKKCRSVGCGIPGFVLKDDKCVRTY